VYLYIKHYSDTQKSLSIVARAQFKLELRIPEGWSCGPFSYLKCLMTLSYLKSD
jgi:hypothetical protein